MKAFNIIIAIFCVAYISGAIASLVTDHLDNVERKVASAEWKRKQHELSIKMCAEGKGSAFIYDGKRCKQN